MWHLKFWPMSLWGLLVTLESCDDKTICFQWTQLWHCQHHFIAFNGGSACFACVQMSRRVSLLQFTVLSPVSHQFNNTLMGSIHLLYTVVFYWASWYAAVTTFISTVKTELWKGEKKKPCWIGEENNSLITETVPFHVSSWSEKHLLPWKCLAVWATCLLHLSHRVWRPLQLLNN